MSDGPIAQYVRSIHALKGCDVCGGAIVHADKAYSMLRGWCEEHTPWSGHYEDCPGWCRNAVAEMRANGDWYVNPMAGTDTALPQNRPDQLNAQLADLRRGFKMAMAELRQLRESKTRMEAALLRQHNNFRAMKGLPLDAARPHRMSKRKTRPEYKHDELLRIERVWNLRGKGKR